MNIYKQQTLTILLPIVAAAIIVPFFVHASMHTNMGAAANKSCKDWWNSPACKSDPAKCQATGKACSAVDSAIRGECEKEQCVGKTASGPGGGGQQSLGSALGLMNQALGLINGLKGLMGGAPAGGGGGAPAPVGGAALPPTPSSFNPYDSIDNRLPAKNLGEDILKNISGEETKTSPLFDSGEPAPNFLEAVAKGFGDITNKVSEVTAGAGTKIDALIPGGEKATTTTTKDRTEVRETDTDATVEVSYDSDGKSGIVGFYGVSGVKSAASGVSNSIVGRLCATRPWATGLVASVISPSFFDKVCARFGYAPKLRLVEAAGAPVDTALASRQAIARMKAAATGNAAPKKKEVGISCTPGVVREGGSATLEWSCGASMLVGTSGFKATADIAKLLVKPTVNTTYGIKCENDFIDACQVRIVRPKLAIWSEPVSARLGSRVIIKWNSTDVFEDTCVVEGPSFHETGARGGASTVGINDRSIFTISCLAADGATTTESVAVDLAL